jgi:gliding motility-associated-like protein
VKTIFTIVLVPFFLLVGFFSANAQGTTNKGTEFWTCYMDHIAPPPGSNMILYITSDIATTGNVTLADNSFSQAFTVTANAVTFVTIPASAFLGAEGQYLKGIHITSANPIAVYAHIYASAVSGATLLFPVNAMGKTYVSLNYKQISNSGDKAPSYSSFVVIATQDSTTVSITPSATLLSGKPANTAFTVTLNKGELYQGLSAVDLTGTQIKSISTTTGACKRIAVFSGSSKIGIGCYSGTDPNAANSLSSDNLFQQVYPTSAWGKNYIAAPLKSRPYDIYRVVLSDPATNVFLNGSLLTAAQFTSGLYYEFTSTTTNVVSADKPIQVVQYTPTQGQGLNCVATKNDVGDPEMIYLSPIEQGLDHVTLYSTGYYAITQSYINVVMPTSAVSTFSLDGNSYTAFQPVASDTSYSYAQIPVTSGPQKLGKGGTFTSGTHTIKASAPFNAIAYGFGSVESYGYAAGTNLQDLNEYVKFLNPVSDTTQIGGCAGVNYKLQLTVPYQTTNISWNFNDGTLPNVEINPTFQSQMVKGNQTLYTYAYPKLVSYTAGTHAVVASVLNPVANECGATDNIEFDFTITNPPVTGFSAPANTCLGDSTRFKDTTSVAIGNYEKYWLWDFGDGQTSKVQNPAHLYKTAGDYAVVLTVTDNNGCPTVSNPVSIHVSTLPVANFTASTPDCANQNITLTDQSTSTDGTIKKWIWSYGDGKTDTLISNQPFTHLYDTTGVDTVSLTVITDKGCISNVYTKVLTIHPLAIVDFTLPYVCLDDAFAQFNDKTTVADSTQSAFTYQWNFGDSSSTAANNISHLQNPKHKYSNQGNYSVSLTVTSKYGCITSKTQSFTVNGATPKAVFMVENQNFLCSADSVTFDDQSYVDFGNVTKLVWYFDYNNHPTDSVVYTAVNMPSDKKYRYFYGLNSTTNANSYQVQMFAYSGQTCFNPVQQNITVYPNPVVNLSPAGPLVLCQTDQPIQFTSTSNIAGTGVYSGTGVSASGLFDPKVSGTGTFTILYVFTATNTGCTDSTSVKITVNAVPVVSSSAELVLLEGGQVTLDAKAAISIGTMTYKWSPALNLDFSNVLNPVANPTNDITYTLTATSNTGCTGTTSIFVKVLKEPTVPNTFTPNGDGINDIWNIKYLDQYPNATVEIFNRYGEKVYYSHNYPIPWDGTYKGSNLPAGTYYYIINPNSGRKALSGHVTIIR